MHHSSLEIKIVDKALEEPLAEFFRALKKAGDDQYFHPHPFNDREAKRIAHYSGKDLYYAIVEGNKVIGYGMLRGWDEGYKVPSLGIVIHPSVRGKGMGKLFMEFLHVAARRRGVKKVRLKVYPNNKAAVMLYKRLGYTFHSEEAGQIVGFIGL